MKGNHIMKKLYDGERSKVLFFKCFHYFPIDDDKGLTINHLGAGVVRIEKKIVRSISEKKVKFPSCMHLINF